MGTGASGRGGGDGSDGRGRCAGLEARRPRWSSIWWQHRPGCIMCPCRVDTLPSSPPKPSPGCSTHGQPAAKRYAILERHCRSIAIPRCARPHHDPGHCLSPPSNLWHPDAADHILVLNPNLRISLAGKFLLCSSWPTNLGNYKPDQRCKMATYHVMAVPKSGENPDSITRPLAPCDVIADSEQDALLSAESLIDGAVGEYEECLMATKGEAAARERVALMQQWQPQARRVDRPAVAVESRSWTSDMVHDGAVVGQRYHYGEETGERSFDVLVGGVVAGLLAQGSGQWRLIKATGPLASLSGRQWSDGGLKGFVYPDAPLADIRAALEAR